MVSSSRSILGMMRSVILGVFLSVAVLSTAVAQQSSGAAQSQPKTQSSKELEDMKSDLTKMRVIVNQMRTNLAFVQTSATPLKHQFELEIDMWQMVLDQMDRRVQRMESSDSQGR